MKIQNQIGKNQQSFGANLLITSSNAALSQAEVTELVKMAKTIGSDSDDIFIKLSKECLEPFSCGMQTFNLKGYLTEINGYIGDFKFNKIIKTNSDERLPLRQPFDVIKDFLTRLDIVSNPEKKAQVMKREQLYKEQLGYANQNYSALSERKKEHLDEADRLTIAIQYAWKEGLRIQQEAEKARHLLEL